MNIRKKNGSFHKPDFFSNEMMITINSLNENQLKYTYQKQLISDLDYKHNECVNLLKIIFKSFH